MTFFIILIDQPHLLAAEGIELIVNEMFRNMNIEGTARFYYDESVEEGTEYGVRVDVKGLSRSDQQGLLAAMYGFSETYGELRVEVS